MIADLIDWASKAETLPMQGLMLLAIIILGLVIVYLFKQSNIKIDKLNEDNKKTQLEWQLRIEAERAAMTQERRDRINMLIEVIKEDTIVKAELKNAIENNTKTIERLETILLQLVEKQR